MSEEFETNEYQEVQDNINELVRRSLIQLGDMDAMQERLRRVSERMVRITSERERPKEKD